MTTAAPSTALATIQPVFTDAERLALAGFLAGYRGLTREAYTLDLRQFTAWCRARSVTLFAARRADIESFARELEAKGRGPRDRHPAAVHHRRVLQVRRRRKTPGPFPGGARPAAAGGLRIPRRRAGPQRARCPPGRCRTRNASRARADVLLALNGLRMAIGERTAGPVFLTADGRRLDRHGAGRIVRKVARRAGTGKTVTPHTLRHAFITAALDAGVPLRDVPEAASHADPRTTMRYDRARGSLDRHATCIVAAYIAGAAR